MNLFSHQARFLQRSANKQILVWETGTGKTITALEWASGITLYPVVLVVCPKTLKENWKRNIVSHYPNLTIEVCSKEEFKSGKFADADYNTVIIDEVHFFSNYKSQMTKKMLVWLKDRVVPNVLGLTATPYMSTPWNIYSLGLLMNAGWSWFSFNKNFFYKVNMGGREVPMVVPDAKAKLIPYIEQISDIVKLADCVDVPDDNLQVEYFALNSQQKTYMKKLFEPHHLTYWTKCHQACGGTVKNTEYDDEAYTLLPSDKLDRVMELGLEVDKPIIVCRYNGEVNLISEELRAQGKTVFVINGETKDKQSVLDQAHATDKCAVVVNAACSEGWQLPSCHTMIFYSYDFSLKNFIQMKGRIQRIDNIQTCTYISLVMQSTVDEDVYRTVAIDKMDFQTDIYK